MTASLEELNNRSELAEESLNLKIELKRLSSLKNKEEKKNKLKRLTEMWDTKKIYQYIGYWEYQKGSTRMRGSRNNI